MNLKNKTNIHTLYHLNLKIVKIAFYKTRSDTKYDQNILIRVVMKLTMINVEKASFRSFKVKIDPTLRFKKKIYK